MVESREAQLDLVFHALSDPTRRAILRSLGTRARPITEVAAPFGMSLAAVSKHVKVLENAHLVHRDRRGSFSYLSVAGDGMQHAQQWIDRYRKLWEGRLDALKHLMEKED